MKNKILILSEIYNDDELASQETFTGYQGHIVKGMCAQVGINYSECYKTSVFKIRPRPTLKIENLCGKRPEGIVGRPPIKPGKYILKKYQSELDRLEKEIADYNPNIIIAFGAVAAWATSGQTKITQIRGVTTMARQGCKVIPMYHPTAINRNWSLRAITIADMAKAFIQSQTKDLKIPKHELWIEPTLDDLKIFEDAYIKSTKKISIDIETAQNQITCIGFAPSIERAIVVPFYDRVKPGHNYWPTLNQEIAAWTWVKRICEMPDVEICGQNFLYDIQYLWVKYGITVPSFAHDTMLLTHAQQPEMLKGLGFLASVHTDEPSWKHMRTKHTGKKED